jgi:hypothetical protein
MFIFEMCVEEKGKDVYVSFVREFINFPDHLLPYSGTGNHRKSDWQ